MAAPDGLPLHAGIGLKPDHYAEVLSAERALWVEVHPENYMVDGGPRLAWLAALRDGRGLSFHGVGASLGGLDPLDRDHLAALAALIRRFEPDQVSEHATFSAAGGRYFADLLPLPRTREALVHLSARVAAFQDAIGRRVLIENPTNYLPFASEMDEPDFLVEVARRAGCGLLLDVNNVWIGAVNVGIDPRAYVDALPADLVGEIHVAGHAPDPNLGAGFLIDSHGAPVSEEVWDLLAHALDRLGPKPVLVERDADIPPFADLKAERDRAEGLIRDAEGAGRDAA